MKDKIFKCLGSSNHSVLERAENDYYSTPKIAVDKLLTKLAELNITLPHDIIEPSVGDGAIAKCLPNHNIIGYDIIDRGYPGTIIQVFLSVDNRPNNPIAIVANFPYKDIMEHTIHSMKLLKDGEYLISLAKIQFLESKARKKMFEKYPPKYVLVFSERIGCFKDGIVSKNISKAICYCWYIFQKGFNSHPTIYWI